MLDQVGEKPGGGGAQRVRGELRELFAQDRQYSGFAEASPAAGRQRDPESGAEPGAPGDGAERVEDVPRLHQPAAGMPLQHGGPGQCDHGGDEAAVAAFGGEERGEGEAAEDQSDHAEPDRRFPEAHSGQQQQQDHEQGRVAEDVAQQSRHQPGDSGQVQSGMGPAGEGFHQRAASPGRRGFFGDPAEIQGERRQKGDLKQQIDAPDRAEQQSLPRQRRDDQHRDGRNQQVGFQPETVPAEPRVGEQEKQRGALEKSGRIPLPVADSRDAGVRIKRLKHRGPPIVPAGVRGRRSRA